MGCNYKYENIITRKRILWFFLSPSKCRFSDFTVFLQCFYSAAPVFLHLFIISQLTLDHLSISWATMNL